jgi:phosphoribosylformimino-5-aminoimidazole carboxamide ribotide isomerase
MRVIPVLDMMGGLVVHARGGKRAAYRPIETPLAASADPADVARGLLAVYPFDALYIADLDGIAGRGRNHDSICALAAEFPSLELWIDDGSATPAAIAALARMPRVRPVVGSETLASTELLAPLLAAGEGRAALSLDSKGDVFHGPPDLLARPDTWPYTVIAMTLAAVGAKAGPDIARVAEIARKAPRSRVVAAGGVRDRADLEALAKAGACAALVATALHAGTIEAGDLEQVAGLEQTSGRS